MKTIYGKQWFRAQKRLTQPLTEDQARKCYESRQLHSVLCHDADIPFCFLTFNKDYVGVGFLDSLLREDTQYQFVELEPKRLFLATAIHREFLGATDQVANATIYSFKPTGAVRIEKSDLVRQATEVAESSQDVSQNWELYPEFSKYDSITRKER